MDMVGLRVRRVLRVAVEHAVDLAGRLVDRSYFDDQEGDAPSDGVARPGDIALEIEKHPGEFFGYSYISGACVQSSFLGKVRPTPDLFSEAKVERFELPLPDDDDFPNSMTRTILSVGYGQADLYLFQYRAAPTPTLQRAMMESMSSVLCMSSALALGQHDPSAVIVGTLGEEEVSVFYAVPPKLIKHQPTGITRLQHMLLMTVLVGLPVTQPVPIHGVDVEALRVAVFDYSLSRVRVTKEGSNRAIN